MEQANKKYLAVSFCGCRSEAALPRIRFVDHRHAQQIRYRRTHSGRGHRLEPRFPPPRNPVPHVIQPSADAVHKGVNCGCRCVNRRFLTRHFFHPFTDGTRSTAHNDPVALQRSGWNDEHGVGRRQRFRPVPPVLVCTLEIFS